MAFEKLVDRYSSTRSLARWDSWVAVLENGNFIVGPASIWPSGQITARKARETRPLQKLINYYKPLKSPDKIKVYYFCRVFVGTLQGTNTSHETGSLGNHRLKRCRLVRDSVIVPRRVLLLGESANRTANHLPKSL